MSDLILSDEIIPSVDRIAIRERGRFVAIGGES